MCPQATLHGAGKQGSTAARGSLIFVLLQGANPMYSRGGLTWQPALAEQRPLLALSTTFFNQARLPLNPPPHSHSPFEGSYTVYFQVVDKHIYMFVFGIFGQ